MQDLDFWKRIADTLYVDVNVCLVTMVAASGEGPNRPGARMAVLPDGQRFGTVGGGNSEKMLSDLAVKMLSTEPLSDPRLLSLSHHDGEGAASGMICSGTQHFTLHCLTPSNRPVLHQILRALSEGISGIIRLSPEGLNFEGTSESMASIRFDPDRWQYEEPVGRYDTVTLIGGGHVSLALTPLLFSLGMRVIVLDNRPDLDTMQSNRLAHARRVVDYENIRSHMLTGPNSYACIMTFGHQHDECVLRQILNLDLRYLGMMGSAHKIRTIFDHMLSEGFPQKTLDKVHAPIGMNIGSNTPEEIAISIVAEIIAVRRGITQ